MKSLDISHIVLVKKKGREHTKFSALFLLYFAIRVTKNPAPAP